MCLSLSGFSVASFSHQLWTHNFLVKFWTINLKSILTVSSRLIENSQANLSKRREEKNLKRIIKLELQLSWGKSWSRKVRFLQKRLVLGFSSRAIRSVDLVSKINDYFYSLVLWKRQVFVVPVLNRNWVEKLRLKYKSKWSGNLLFFD